MKLFIDTTQTKKAIVTLENEKKVQKEGDSPLPLIEKILCQEKIKLEDLSEIEAHLGPGSFTGIRVGVAVANALNYALGKKKKPSNIRRLLVCLARPLKFGSLGHDYT